MVCTDNMLIKTSPYVLLIELLERNKIVRLTTTAFVGSITFFLFFCFLFYVFVFVFVFVLVFVLSLFFVVRFLSFYFLSSHLYIHRGSTYIRIYFVYIYYSARKNASNGPHTHKCQAGTRPVHN